MSIFSGNVALLLLTIIELGTCIPREFSHYVDIRRGTASLNYNLCSGVIVHPNWVLTATQGQCYVRLYKIIAGDLNEEAVEGTEQAVTPTGTYIKHPTHPVALVKVNPAFEFNDYVQPAIFPTADIVTPGSAVRTCGKNPTTNGGYFQRIVQETTLALEASESCRYGTVGPDYSCLVGEGSNQKCAADSGSPVQCEDNVFCGLVTSRGDCFKDSPTNNDPPPISHQSAIHTALLTDWIMETVGSK
jgi:hypothetical protein